MDPIEEGIRRRLAAWLQKHPMSQKALEKRLNWGQSSISEFLNGKRGIDLARSVLLAQLMRVPVSSLIDDRDAPPDLPPDDVAVLTNYRRITNERRRRNVEAMLADYAELDSPAKPSGEQRRSWKRRQKRSDGPANGALGSDRETSGSSNTRKASTRDGGKE